MINKSKTMAEYNSSYYNGDRRTHNDIRELRTVKQLELLRLNLDSPRMAKALQNLGIKKHELANKYLTSL